MPRPLQILVAALLLHLCLAPRSVSAAPEVGSDAPRLVLPAGHSETIIGIATSPDDRWVVSLGSTSELKLWNLQTGTDLGTILVSAEPEELSVAVFARSDTQFYVVTSKRILLIDVPSLDIKQSIRIKGEVGSATLSTDREQLWLGGQEDTKMNVSVLRRGKGPIRRVFEMESFAEGGYIRRDKKGIPVVSPNGKYAIPTRSRGEPLKLYRLEDRAALIELAPPANDKRSAEGSWGTFLADGKVLFCHPAGPDQTWLIEVLDPETLQRLTRQPISITSFLPPVCVTPIGSTNNPMISAADGYYVLDGTELDGQFPAKTGRVTAATWYSGSRYASVGVEGAANDTKTYSVQRLDRASGAIAGNTTVATFAPAQITASHDGRAIHLIDQHRRGRVLKITDKGITVARAEVPRSVQAVFLPNSSQIAIGGGAGDTEVMLFASDTMKEIRTLKLGATTSGRVGSDFIAVSPSGQLLADMHFEETRIFRLATGERIATLKGGFYGFEGRNSVVAISPDDSKVVFYSIDKGEGTLYRSLCYDIQSGRLLWSFDGDSSSFRFSDDSKRLHAVIYHDFGWKFLTLDAATGKIERKVELPRSELVKQSAYDPTGKTIAVTDGQTIELIDVRSGQAINTFAAPTTRGLAFIGDRLIAGIGAENAIRFWDRRSGQLTGTVVVSPTADDWAAIHPSGRFDASSSYQDSLYFVHDGSIIPLGAYFETFFTPGLASSFLSGEAPPGPVPNLSDLRRPPTVKVALAGYSASNGNVPTTNEEKVAIEIAVDGHGNPIEDIRLYHNGKRLLARQRNLVVEDDKADAVPSSVNDRRDLLLTPGENVFRVIALNQQRTESVPAELRIVYSPKVQTAEASAAQIQLHLLVVGLNSYRNPKYNLNYAVADATAVAKAFEGSSGKVFARTNLHTLFDQQATRAGILAKFQEIADSCKPSDVFVFYYAGHGVMSSEAKSEFFLVPHEVTQLYGADEMLRDKAVPSSALLEFSQLIPAQKQLFLLDACQSAGALNALARGAGEDKAIAQLARASGTHWITASGSEQFATEFEKLGHGTFTHALLEGLSGKADNGDGRITVNELKAWLESQVPELTKQHKGTPQYPSTYGFGQDFPVAVR